MIDYLHYPFFYQSLLLGCLLSIVCGIMGTLIVLKRLTYLSASISHTVLGGVGMGLLWGVNPVGTAYLFGCICTSIIAYVQTYFKEKEDTLISITWTMGMSIGIVCLSLAKGYGSDFSHYLFGNILINTTDDIVLLGSITAIVIGTLAVFLKPFIAIILDPVYAKIINVRVGILYFLFLQLITITCVILMKIIGGLLLIALLTIPPATARNITSGILSMMAVSVALCALSTLMGIVFSFALNLPSGPCIVINSCLIYSFSLLFKYLKNRYFKNQG